ncbi:MAG TPA: PAS domain-containing protein, partial [Candidatus Thermoplasmatota archaeon]|nr:PAS domain-containing protein [Candidatus Thermoplasmatota archaeon]
RFLTDLLAPEDVEDALEAFALAAAGKPQHRDLRLRHKEGSLLRLSVYMLPIVVNGTVEGVFGIAKDVTEARRATAAMVAARERVENLLETMTDAFLAIDREGRFTAANPEAGRLLGRHVEELLGKRARDLFEPSPEIRGHIQSAAATGKPAQFESYYSPFDRWFDIRVYPGEDGYSLFFRDITARKKSEEALRASEGRLRALVTTAPVILFMLDPEGSFTLSEGKALEALGLSPGEVVGKSARELYGEYPEVVASIERALAGESFTETVNLGGLTFEVWYTPSRDPHGSVEAVLGVAIDITQRKQAEEEVRRLNESLEMRVRRRTAELEAANRELEAFSYTVSHDLRAPLRGIQAFTQALLEDYGESLSEGGVDYVRQIERESRRMALLIEDLLNLSRVTRGGLHREDLNLSGLARVVAGELQRNEPSRKVEFVIEDGLRVDADPRLLRVVLENLLGNAWKYTRKEAKPRIEVGVLPNGGERVFFVRDNGVGFDPARAHELFTPFRRLHPSREFEGTGVGLATVHRIVTRHGGRIWAEGAQGEGATFYFTLG